MTRVLSMRLQEPQMGRLQRLARRLGRTPSETGALLLEEALRRAEFGMIDFRDSPAGRQAYVQGTGLAVWETVEIVQSYAGDTDRAAAHLHWPVARVRAALGYAEAFPEEITTARADNAAYDALAVSRMLPGTTVFSVGSAVGSAVGNAAGNAVGNAAPPDHARRPARRRRTD